MSLRYTVATYSTSNPALLSKWKHLWRSSPSANHINSPMWFTSALSAYHYKDFKIITVSVQGELVAVLGVVKKNKYGISCYTLSGEFGSGNPVLVSDEHPRALILLISQLSVLGTVYLETLPESILRLLKKYVARGIDIETGLNLYIPLDRDHKTNIIGNARHVLQGRQKYLSKLSLVQYHATQELDQVFKISNDSSKSKSGYNIFANIENIKFYQNLASVYGRNFVVNLLKNEEGTALAYELGFAIGHTYYGSQIAYLATAKKFAPGKVMCIKLCEIYARRNYLKVDLGSGSSPYKLIFTKEGIKEYTFIKSNNPLLTLYLGIMTRLQLFIYHELTRHKQLYSSYHRLRQR